MSMVLLFASRDLQGEIIGLWWYLARISFPIAAVWVKTLIEINHHAGVVIWNSDFKIAAYVVRFFAIGLIGEGNK